MSEMLRLNVVAMAWVLSIHCTASSNTHANASAIRHECLFKALLNCIHSISERAVQGLRTKLRHDRVESGRKGQNLDERSSRQSAVSAAKIAVSGSNLVHVVVPAFWGRIEGWSRVSCFD